MFELPLFPLNAVLFPGMPIYLHIFETRYRLMIRKCLDGDQTFGVVLIRQGNEAFGPLADTYSVGCTARIVKNEMLEDGRMNLTALGGERFRILNFSSKNPYLVGKVETIPLEEPSIAASPKMAPELEAQIAHYLKLLSQLSKNELDVGELEMPNEPLTLMYLAASLLQLPATEKQALLAAENGCQLLVEIRRLYKRETVLLTQTFNVSRDQALRSAWLN